MAAGRGQASTVWRARPLVIARTLAAHGPVLAAVLLPPALFALAEGEWRLALALGLPGAVALCGWLVHSPKDLRGLEAVVTLVGLFGLGAALPVPAFAVLGMGPVDAVFESVSAITSTGLTVAVGTMDWPLAGHMLRGWLQWSGGFAIAVAGVAVIVGPGAAARAMADIGLEQRDLLSSTRTQARQLITVYAALTGIGILALLPLMPSWWEAVAIALTAVSTGGFTPRPDSLAAYSRAAQAVTLLLCLGTTVTLMAYVIARRSGPRAALAGTNAKDVLLLWLGGLVVVGGLFLLSSEFTAGDLADSLLNFTSGLTTAGFSVAPVAEAPSLLAVLLAAMVIGGGAGSTAGGIKVDRAVTMLRMGRLALLRLRMPPRAVSHLKEDGRPVEAGRMVALVAVVGCYAATAFVAWVVFLASGIDPLAGLFDIVSALSTVGLSSGVTGADLAPHLKLVLAAAMFLGRLEFLAVLVALSPATWTTGSGS